MTLRAVDCNRTEQGKAHLLRPPAVPRGWAAAASSAGLLHCLLLHRCRLRCQHLHQLLHRCRPAAAGLQKGCCLALWLR
jgi:hypothetical protein